jgi:ferredoxin, 2Fe-2S
MVDISVTLRDGSKRALRGIEGQSLMEALRNAGVAGIDAICGGNCVCATCHVYLESPPPAQLSPIGSDENDLLDCSDHRRETSRLSCQVRLSAELGQIVVGIPPPD